MLLPPPWKNCWTAGKMPPATFEAGGLSFSAILPTLAPKPPSAGLAPAEGFALVDPGAATGGFAVGVGAPAAAAPPAAMLAETAAAVSGAGLVLDGPSFPRSRASPAVAGGSLARRAFNVAATPATVACALSAVMSEAAAPATAWESRLRASSSASSGFIGAGAAATGGLAAVGPAAPAVAEAPAAGPFFLSFAGVKKSETVPPSQSANFTAPEASCQTSWNGCATSVQIPSSRPTTKPTRNLGSLPVMIVASLLVIVIFSSGLSARTFCRNPSTPAFTIGHSSPSSARSGVFERIEMTASSSRSMIGGFTQSGSAFQAQPARMTGIIGGLRIAAASDSSTGMYGLTNA